MTPERWTQIEELFHQAVECDPLHRASLLDQACRNDPTLRREVEALLSSDAAAGASLQSVVRAELDAIGFPLTGKTVSHYRILGGLGGGGMGLVYRAEDIRLGRMVALKFMPEESAADPSALQRFEREARSASALEHPNICPIYEFGEHEGQAFLVMQLLQGQTLRELLESRQLSDQTSKPRSGADLPANENGPLGPDEILNLAIQIADGLDAAHQKGIIHRDIKPANIFITTQGQAKILDFGLAKLAGDLTMAGDGSEPDLSGESGAGEKHPDTAPTATLDPQLSRTGRAMGTAGYMSPEQARGEKPDARTDVFSFGLVLYEMATGKHAFKGDTGPALHDAILREIPPPARELNPALPASLEKAIDRALQKDREQRYPSMTEMRRDLGLVKQEMEAIRPLNLSALRERRPWVAGALLAAALAVIISLAAVWMVSPRPTPIIHRTVQLTHFGRVDGLSPVVSDGAELYFVERTGNSYRLARTSANGGEPSLLTTPFHNVALYDISPDHSELLVGSFTAGEDERPLWALPTSGGSPRRLGNVTARDAAWSPDGRRIVYVTGSDLYLVKPDGSEARKLVGTEGEPYYIRWSPDGSILCMSLADPATHRYSLWEVSAEGTNLHRLLVGWREPPTEWGDGESGGDWTADGKYFIFRSARAHTASIWAMRWRRGLVDKPFDAPVLLTTTDLYLWKTLPARNGKRVFFVGDRNDDNRELQRYDYGLNQFVPYLSGVPARWASFSRDGQWVAYVTMPRFVLWRSRLDGSDRLQLTFPPIACSRPQWSPDGKAIIFAREARVYVLPSDGGTPEAVTPEQYPADDPEWSPGGNSLLFSARTPGGGVDTWAIHRLDLGTRRASRLPGSQGLRAPAYSPDGTHIVAVSADGTRLMLFDVQSDHWTELAQGKWLFTPYWSRDNKYVYCQDLAGVEQPVFRVRISDRKQEVIATRKQFARADATAYSLAGLTPNGDPLVSLRTSDSDIYALDVDLP